MEDIRQTVGWKNHLAHKGWKTVRIKTADGKHSVQVFILRVGWWPLTMLKLQRSNYDPDFKELKRIKRKYRVVSTAIEPVRVQNPAAYKKAGYHLTRFPFLAMSTYIDDLRKSEKELWTGLSENARRLVNKNKKTVIEGTDPETFCREWQKCAKIWIMPPKEVEELLEGFGGKARLVVSRVGKEYHSGLIIIYSKDTANYLQTWTNEAGRKSGAHYKLVWEELRRAKKAGLKYFDFEGVYDERWPQKKWKGFTEFKRRFGGKLVHYPGSYFKTL
jgi:hypothetical protein